MFERIVIDRTIGIKSNDRTQLPPDRIHDIKSKLTDHLPPLRFQIFGMDIIVLQRLQSRSSIGHQNLEFFLGNEIRTQSPTLRKRKARHLVSYDICCNKSPTTPVESLRPKVTPLTGKQPQRFPLAYPHTIKVGAYISRFKITGMSDSYLLAIGKRFVSAQSQSDKHPGHRQP